MSEPKFLQLAETIEEETRRLTRSYLGGAVRSCSGAIEQIKALAADRGGKTAYLAELGDDAQPVVVTFLELKALVETLSDLTVNVNIPEAPE